MSLPGLLIEYLMTGAVALLWVFVAVDSRNVFEIQNVQLFLLPVAYILGMIIDAFSYGLTYWPKAWVRNFAFKTANPEISEEDKMELKNNDSALRTKIQKEHKEPSNEINMRKSRDRIARAMIVNSICLIVFLPNEYLTAKLLMLIVSIICWVFFEYKSHTYFLMVQKNINATLA